MSKYELDFVTWRSIAHIASMEGISTNSLCDLVNHTREAKTFQEAIQVFCVAYFRQELRLRIESRTDTDLALEVSNENDGDLGENRPLD